MNMENEEIKKYLSKIGKKGGAATKAKHGPDYYRKIGRLGNKAQDKKIS